MLDFGFYNMDCMEGMKQFPDKYFDLAIVDPPYGAKVGRGGTCITLLLGAVQGTTSTI
jgi:DNA modification methylase